MPDKLIHSDLTPYDTLLTELNRSPEKTMQELKRLSKSKKPSPDLCTVYRLLSIGYALLKQNDQAWMAIETAESHAKNPNQELYIKTRKAAQYLTERKDLRALTALSSAIEDYKLLQNKDSNLLLQIKINLILVLRNIGDHLLQSMLLDEVQQELDSFNHPILHASYHYIKASMEFDDELYVEAEQSFLTALSHYEHLAISDKTEEIKFKAYLSKFKSNPIESNEALSKLFQQYENNLLHPTFIGYLTELGSLQINPFIFYTFSHKQCIDILKHLLFLNELYAFHAFSKFVYDYFNHIGKLDLIAPYLNEIQQINEDYKKQLNGIQETEEVFQQEFSRIKSNPHADTLEEPAPSPIRASIQNFILSNIRDDKQMEIVKSKKLDASKLLWNDFSSQIAINSLQGIKFLETNSIARLEADGPYTALIDIDNKTHLSSKNLAFYEDRLDNNQFVRIHRSTIVNKKYIKNLHKGRVGILELSNGVKLEVAARRMFEIKQKLFGIPAAE